MYIYSKEKNAFYPLSMKQDYIDAGSWPGDGVKVDEEVFAAFQIIPSGKVRIAGDDGMPAWGELPPLTHEQLVEVAEMQRNILLAQGNEVTADWRTELALGIISDEDRASLTVWMQYIKQVKAVDSSALPVCWPIQPA